MNRMQQIFESGKIFSTETVVRFHVSDMPIVEVDLGSDPLDGPWERAALFSVVNNISTDTTDMHLIRLDENGRPILGEVDAVILLRNVRPSGYRLAE